MRINPDYVALVSRATGQHVLEGWPSWFCLSGLICSESRISTLPWLPCLHSLDAFAVVQESGSFKGTAPHERKDALTVHIRSVFLKDGFCRFRSL